MAEYSNHIKQYREKKNMTQQELAERLGTNVRNIRRWENGEAVIDVLKAMKISEILGYSIKEIFGV